MYEKLYQYMADSSLLNQDTLVELDGLVTLYPYFYTARMLYLKNLAVTNDARFDNELQRTAIYVSDRRALFMLIEEVRLIVETDAERPQTEKENTLTLIDGFLDLHDKRPDRNMENMDMHSLPVSGADYTSILKDEGQNVEVGEPLFPPGVEEFIRDGWKRPLIKPEVNVKDAPIVDDSPLDPSCNTEYMARICIKQKNYSKALEIIKSISLNNPQKNVYFADQIRFLEKLIINSKNKN